MLLSIYKEKIKNFYFLIKDKYKVKGIILYGSYAKGTTRKDSDIDVLVDLDYSKFVGLEFVQMQLDLQDLFSQKVDLVSSRGLSKHVKPIIENEKVMIYER